MIKEYSYYITTDRFSQIAEDIDAAVRKYAESMMNDAKGDAALRESARKLCEEQAVLSGMRSQGESFINIDAEFFTDGELSEARLGRFIKDVVKAHGFQRILWEYMGTTGLMTEISRDKMREDGFRYIDYLPVSMKEAESEREKNSITWNFMRLADDSGFDWSKGYDPNYTVSKKGWRAGYDENHVWTYHAENGVQAVAASGRESVHGIRLVKTDNGCMLYDIGKILINPVILWYLALGNRLYGGEISDTASMVKEIKAQLDSLGEEKITDIAVSPKAGKLEKKKLVAEYKRVLGDLISEKAGTVSADKAMSVIAQKQDEQKRLHIEQELSAIQEKIDAIERAKPGITAGELKESLETGKASIALDISLFEDAVACGFTEEEYATIRKSLEPLEKADQEKFKHACAVLGTEWKDKDSDRKSMVEYIRKIYEYIYRGTEAEICHEESLRDVLSRTQEASAMEDVLSDVESYIPEENRETVREYLLSVPGQKPEVKHKVFSSLKAAVRSYVAIRGSTGMSVRELLDYAIKSCGGTLPRASYAPPAIGYVTPGMRTSQDAGDRRIYIEEKVSSLAARLLEVAVPEKEVPFEQLIKPRRDLSGAEENKPVVAIGNMNERKDFEPVYDTRAEADISDAVLLILRNLYVPKSGGKDSTRKLPELKKELLEIAEKNGSREDFIKAVSGRFSIRYDIQDEAARRFLETAYPAGTVDILAEYAGELQRMHEKEASKGGTASPLMRTIPGVYRQIDLEDAAAEKVRLPPGAKPMAGKTGAEKGLEEIKAMRTRVRAESPGMSVLSEEEKNEASVLIESVSAEDRAELIHLTGGDYNTMTPLLIREYLWRKKNRRKLRGLSDDVREAEYRGFRLTPDKGKPYTYGTLPVSMAAETNPGSKEREAGHKASGVENLYSSGTTLISQEIPFAGATISGKERNESSRGTAERGISPVIAEYLMARAAEKRQDSAGDEKGTASSGRSSQAATLEIPPSRHERIDLEEPHRMGEVLRNSLEGLSEMRIPAGKADPMAIMNANYEHDRAVLAKTDPMFARNLFHDVGHADGSGEITEREIQKIVSKQSDDLFENLLRK